MANLVNLANGDRLNLRVEGQILLSESIKNGKTRQTQKEFASAGEVQKACVKKEWESLKKGYVLQNANAKAGEASLHVYIGGGYTGALAFAGAGDDFFVYKCGGYKEGGALYDFLIRLDASGAVKQQIVLPKPLAWHAERAGEILLLDLDHDIFKFNPQTGEFTNVFKELKIKRNGDITSCVCASGETAAFAAYGQIYLLKDGKFSSHGKYKTDSGCGAAFCVALSTDGMRLALSCKQNEIKITSTMNGEILNEIKGDFGALSDVCFLKDGSLLGREYYEGGLVFFDAAGSRQTPAWMRGECAKAQKIRVSADGSRLALINYDKARIIDLKS
uniref:hypothetical protein n=1 Tax=uncultured Campylobacter sp. TaxID=218934 RepID=UPI0026163B44